jgi:hypothetical protein
MPKIKRAIKPKTAKTVLIIVPISEGLVSLLLEVGGGFEALVEEDVEGGEVGEGDVLDVVVIVGFDNFEAVCGSPKSWAVRKTLAKSISNATYQSPSQ